MSEWYQGFKSDVSLRLREMKEMQVRHLNIKLFNQTAKKIDIYAENCPKCKAYQQDYNQILNTFDDLLKDDTLKKSYEAKLIETTHHLKKEHRVRPSNYYISLYSLLGIGIGLLITGIYAYSVHQTLINTAVIYGALIGNILGWAIGYFTDKKMKRKGLTL